MKKVLFISLALFLLCSGAVYASTSLYGKFKGNDIIKVTSGGKEIIATDVPAVSLNNRTMVPIYMLRNLGIQVSWDQSTSSVDVSLPTSNQPFSVQDEISKVKSLGFQSAMLYADASGITYISYSYNGDINNVFNNTSILDTLFRDSIESNATDIQIIDTMNQSFIVPMDKVIGFYNGTVTTDELSQSYIIKLNQPNTNQQPITGSAPPTQNNSTTTVNMCTDLESQYQQAKQEFLRSHDPTSGRTTYLLQSFENDWKNKFILYGCNQ